MGGSMFLSEDRRMRSSRFPVGKYNLQVRNTKRDSMRQWAIIYRCISYKVFQRPENKEDHHPSANGQAESTNKVIIQNLKKRLEAAKGKWPEELAGVLWAYRTKAKSSIGETPLSLVYGVEALIQVEVGEPTLRYSQANKESNDEAMLINLELLEGRRDLAHVRMAAQKQRMKRYYNRRANFCFFKVGDLVIRKVTHNTRELNTGKLGPR
ncbi:uncharacterized protein [Nicotiana tomentosiformis]|uniref:uncharacterized protein n=1 Tax=Nicotiana tomentosiformis TaxID=4098 RepID=UPI00388CEBCA